MLILPAQLKIGDTTWPLTTIAGPTHAAHADHNAVTLHFADAQCAAEVYAVLEELIGSTLELCMHPPDPLQPLAPEELAKIPPLSKEAIDEALEKGRQDREKCEAALGPGLCKK
jgi:hypothetical protein